MMNVTSVHHTGHVSFDPVTGRFVGLPKEWEKAVMSSFGLPVALYVSEVVPGYVSRIPKVLVKMRQFLHDKEGFKQHGIFRVAPDQAERDVVLTQLAAGTFQDCRDVHCIATAIKVWFRDLPTPLFQRLDIEAVKNCNSDEEAISLLNSQTEPVKSLALWLMDVCCDVVEFAKVNAMSAKNMSIVVSPNLIRLDTRKEGDPIEVFKLSKRFTDFFERCLNVRMKQRGSKVAPRKISVRPVAPRGAALSITNPSNSSDNNATSGKNNNDNRASSTQDEMVPPAPDSDDELPPENPPPEPDSEDDYPPPPPRPSPSQSGSIVTKSGFVLPLVNPLEMLSFQLVEYFPSWTAALEPRIPAGPCAECDQAGTLYCAACFCLLCETHDAALHSFRSRAAHTRTATEDAVGIPTQCESHFQLLKFFCLTCGSPVCRDCRECDIHSGHMIVLIVFTPPKKKPPPPPEEPQPPEEKSGGAKPNAKNDHHIDLAVSPPTTTIAPTKNEVEPKSPTGESKGPEGNFERKASESQRRAAPQKAPPVKPKIVTASSSFTSALPPSLPSSPTPTLSPSLSPRTVSEHKSPPPPPPSESASAVTPPAETAVVGDAPKAAVVAEEAKTTAEAPKPTIKANSVVGEEVKAAVETTSEPAKAETKDQAEGVATEETTITTTEGGTMSSSASAIMPKNAAANAKPAAASAVSALPRAAGPGVFTAGQSVRALFDFSRSQKGYVTMTAREILTVVKSSPQLSATGWVLVKNVAGMHGYVPVNYVKGI